MKRAPAIMVAIALLGWTFDVIRADTVHLKSGVEIDGKVLEDGEDKVRIEVDIATGKAVISIDKDRVREVETADSREQNLARGQALLDDEEFEDAEAIFRELVRSQPGEPRARLGLAKALVGLERDAEATKTLEHQRELNDTRDPDVALYLAAQYLEAGEYRDAREVARQVSLEYRDNEPVRERAREFLDRIDRVRKGVEALNDRREAAAAEIRRRIEERKEWDEELGNSFESVETGSELADWAAGHWPGLVRSRHLELEADAKHWRAFQSGGDREDLQREVRDVKMKFAVDKARWIELYDHQKSVILYGWYYQLRAVYPSGDPVVTVVSQGGDEERLARASWDGRREQVVVDRWTAENRDPDRPLPRRVK